MRTLPLNESRQFTVGSLQLAMRDTDTDSDGEHRKEKDRKSGSLSGSNVFLYAKLWCIQLKNCQLFQDGAKECEGRALRAMCHAGWIAG